MCPGGLRFKTRPLERVYPEPVSRAFGKSACVVSGLRLDRRQHILEVGELVPHFRFVPAQDLEALLHGACTAADEFDVSADVGQWHSGGAQLQPDAKPADFPFGELSSSGCRSLDRLEEQTFS